MYRVGVIGLGFVGLSLSVALASKGFNVVGVDIDEKKVDLIKNGSIPIHEEGLGDLLKFVINKDLIISTDFDLLNDSDIVFVCVGTPTLPNGKQDISQVINAIRIMAEQWKTVKERKVIAIKSTVLPGTTRRMAKLFEKISGKKVPQEIGFIVNPEFLREGKAIFDIFHPNRVVIGYMDDESCRMSINLWREFYYKRVGYKPSFHTMNIEEAELVKYASNAFLAMRISFANTIANICEMIPNCDVMKILDAVGHDPRIGKEYLNPGLGYGGACLPKDIKALIHFSKNIGYEPILLEAVDIVNDLQSNKAIEYLNEELKDLKGKIIAIIGLAFKAGTDDIRGSISIKIIKKLLNYGSIVKVYDPIALRKAKNLLADSVIYCNSVESALKDADAAIIATEWDTFVDDLKPEIVTKLMNNPVIIDGRRVIKDLEVFIKNGVKVYPIGYSYSHL